MGSATAYTAREDGFYPVLQSLLYEGGARNTLPEDISRVLQKSCLTPHDFAALLAPAAAESLEAVAQRAHTETLRVFGRAKQLFAPLYLGNYCTNKCIYCGFHAGQGIARRALEPDAIEREAKALAATGLRKVLALTGDAPRRTGADYIAGAVSILARHFSSVGIEVQALTGEEYAAVCRAGADSMTMFQETYDADLYARLHLSGPKRDFAFRLDAPHRAALAGMRGITMGALLGLGDWRFDIFMLGMHARWLQQQFPHLELSFSLPRIRPCAEEESRAMGASATGKDDPAKTALAENSVFTPVPVSDREFVQALVALRCFLPHAGITLSTRESAGLRDKLLPLGVTKLSAGVRTSVGGYDADKPAGEKDIPAHDAEERDAVQFVIDDSRSVAEMATDLERMGYQPIFTDWLLPEAHVQ